MGEHPHANVQNLLCFIFQKNREQWGVRPLPEQRVQVSPERFRISDITVLRSSDPWDPIVAFAPLIYIEVLSKGDALHEIQQRVDDYARLGVQHIWIVDPWIRGTVSVTTLRTKGFGRSKEIFWKSWVPRFVCR